MDDIFLSDTYRIPLAVERGPGGEKNVRPHEADPTAVQRCPACGCVVRRSKRKAVYFRHPQGGETCNAESVLHPYAITQMRLLLSGVDRGLLQLEIAEPRQPGGGRRHIWRVPVGDATADNHHDQARNLAYDVVHLRDGHVQLAIEIRHTHPVDADKRARMPRPWFEIQARAFLRPEVVAALEDIQAGRRVASVLRLQGVGPPRRIAGPSPPPEPEQPDDLPHALRKYRARVERLRSSHALERGLVLLGEPCRTHSGARMECRIPRSAWTDTSIGDPVHDGAHLLLRHGTRIVLGILVVGSDSQINQITGRPLALHRPIPLALIPADLLKLLMRHVPVQLNSHALSGPWHCPVCERLALDEQRRVALDRKVRDLQATIAHILQHHTDLVASRSLPPEARIDDMIEREIAPYLIGADDEVASRIGGSWRFTARSLAAVHRQRQAEIERLLTPWRDTLWMMRNEIERATTRDEIVRISQQIAASLPEGDPEAADIATARHKAVLQLQTQASKRLETISKPAWRLSHAQDQAIQLIHAARSAAEVDAILAQADIEMRDIPADDGVHPLDPAIVRTRIQVEADSYRRTASTSAQAAMRANLDQAMTQARSIDDIDAIRSRFRAEIARWADTWSVSPDDDLGRLQQALRTRLIQGCPGGITARATEVLKGPVDQHAVDAFLRAVTDLKERVCNSLRLDGDVPDDFARRWDARLDIERARLERARLAPDIWASWMVVQGEVMSRWGGTWNRHDRAAIDGFRNLLAHHRIAAHLVPDAISAACAMSEASSDHWKVRGAIRDALPPLGIVLGAGLAAPGGTQESIF